MVRVPRGTDDGTDTDDDGLMARARARARGGRGRGRGRARGRRRGETHRVQGQSYDCSGTRSAAERIPPEIEQCGDMPDNGQEYAKSCAKPMPRRCRARPSRVSSASGIKRPIRIMGTYAVLRLKTSMYRVQDATVTPALVSTISKTVLTEAEYQGEPSTRRRPTTNTARTRPRPSIRRRSSASA